MGFLQLAIYEYFKAVSKSSPPSTNGKLSCSCIIHITIANCKNKHPIRSSLCKSLCRRLSIRLMLSLHQKRRLPCCSYLACTKYNSDELALLCWPFSNQLQVVLVADLEIIILLNNRPPMQIVICSMINYSSA